MITLASPFSYHREIKKSRFFARASPVTSPDAAMEFLGTVRDQQATHNCWAYKIGSSYRSSDDGEPGGTAGRPILAAIEGQGLDHVMVVVTRFFGGIKLGAGGLARAYGGVAAECLRQAPKVEMLPTITARIKAGFDFVGPVYSLLDQFGAEKLQEQYTPEGLIIELRLEAYLVAEFRTILKDLSRGSTDLELLDPESPSA